MAVIISVCVYGALFYHVVYELLKRYFVKRFLLAVNYISEANSQGINDAAQKADNAEIAERSVEN